MGHDSWGVTAPPVERMLADGDRNEGSESREVDETMREREKRVESEIENA